MADAPRILDLLNVIIKTCNFHREPSLLSGNYCGPIFSVTIFRARGTKIKIVVMDKGLYNFQLQVYWICKNRFFSTFCANLMAFSSLGQSPSISNATSLQNKSICRVDSIKHPCPTHALGWLIISDLRPFLTLAILRTDFSVFPLYMSPLGPVTQPF